MMCQKCGYKNAAVVANDPKKHHSDLKLICSLFYGPISIKSIMIATIGHWHSKEVFCCYNIFFIKSS